MDQLEGDENDFDPFFSPKLRKMEHAGGEAGDPGAPEMQPRAAARSFRSRARPSPRLYLGWLMLQTILEDENDFDPFFTPKMRKMELGSRSRWSRWSPGNGTTGGCVEPPFLTAPFEIASEPVLGLAAALGSS